jgi:hypothetical protein
MEIYRQAKVADRPLRSRRVHATSTEPTPATQSTPTTLPTSQLDLDQVAAAQHQQLAAASR